MRSFSKTHALALMAFAVPLSSAAAQDRLTSFKTISIGAIYENVDFGSGGLAQTANGGASVVKSANQFLIPISLTVPISTNWSFDLASLYSNGEAKLLTASSATSPPSKLNGMGDVRLRVSGKLKGDALVATLGVNLASGVRNLDNAQIEALGVLAAPALGLYLPAISSGPSETFGLVSAKRIDEWSYALGASYELRSSYSPVAALSSGLQSPKFNPGDAIHLSAGGDRLIGEHSLSVALVADLYTSDKVIAFGSDPGSTVKLGPTFGADATFHIASRTFKDAALYISDRSRGSFKRNGTSVDGSSANYVTGGLRGGYQLGRTTDLTGSVDIWHHSGITSDQSLVTAATNSQSLTLGLDVHSGAFSFRPFVRARHGTIDTGIMSATASGFSIGTSLVRRF